MPAGPSAFGFVYFAAAKFAGYTAFCRYVIGLECRDRETPTPPIPSAWKAGAVRTGIGLVVGTVVGLSFWRIPYFAQHDPWDTPIFFAILIPIRIAEWWLLLHWIYRVFDFSPIQKAKLILLGIVTSFALDGLGILVAFVLPGGMWVC
jgi:hypothetical protein